MFEDKVTDFDNEDMMDLKIMAGYLLPGVGETHRLPPWISQIFVVKIFLKYLLPRFFKYLLSRFFLNICSQDFDKVVALPRF